MNEKTYLWKGLSYRHRQLEEVLNKQLSLEKEEWELKIIRFALQWLDESNSSFSVQTSGSTGQPKSIIISREQMVESAQATAQFLDLKAGDTALLVLPANFIAGKMMIVRALELQLDLHYFPPHIDSLEHINHAFDFAAIIPMQFQYLADLKLDHFKYLNKVIIGGAALSDFYRNQFPENHQKVFATYGMTETITHIAMMDLKQKENIFKALPGITFQLDERGCLQINSQRLPETITKTNDVVELISKTQFVLQGRVDAVINSGGLKIHAEKLEEQISAIIKRKAFIGYQQDPFLGQRIVLVLDAQEGKVDESLMQEKLRNVLDHKLVPKNTLMIASFIFTENKKINRKQMQLFVAENSKDI